MRRRIAVGLVVAGFCLGVLVTRAVWQGRQALSAGDASMEAGQIGDAIFHYRRSARWYVPLAPHVGDALGRLAELAAGAESQGNAEVALAAWRGVRGSVLATRSFFTPNRDRLDTANQHIARLMSEQPARETAGRDAASSGQLQAMRLQLLQRDDAPSVLWSVIALVGFALWLAGGLLFALRAVDSHDKLVTRSAVVSGLLVAAGLVVWLAGLRYA